MNQQSNRVQPRGEVHQYQTYSIQAGNDQGVVTACRDAGCQAWAHGWETTVDERTPLGLAQARYVRGQSGRTFTERKTAEGLTVFRFEAFQRCFTEHRTRPDVFTRRHGDWRGNPSGQVHVHARPQDWVEDFMEHQARIDQAAQKG